MNAFRILTLSISTVAVLTTSTLIHAAPPPSSGWFFEGIVGKSKQSGKSYRPDVQIYNSGLAVNANIVYKFLPYIAMEAGGTTYSNSTLQTTDRHASFAIDKHWSADFALRGIMPIGESGADLFGKVGGVLMYSIPRVTDTTIANDIGYKSPSVTYSPNFFYGAGFDYFFMPTVAVNAQWHHAVGDSYTANQDFYAVGVAIYAG